MMASAQPEVESATCSAVPRRELVLAMEKIGRTLAEHRGKVTINGHTDARPFTSGDYDNWRLSTARAQSTYYMLVRGGLEEARVVSVAGFADRKLKRGDAFLLRVGRHSGAESVTVSGARTGNIRIMEGKDPQTGKRHFSFADSPKTLWLAAETKDQRKGLLPFGWLLVEIQPLDAPDQDWPELRELCEPRLQQARSFAARLEQQADRHARARAEAEQRRLQEIEQARKQADEEARETKEAAERQARLAAMSENARQVEALRARMGPANKGRRQGDQLYQQTNQLIKAAAGWSTEDRQLLRAAAVAIFEHLGLKKDDYKKLIRDLPL